MVERKTARSKHCSWRKRYSKLANLKGNATKSEEIKTLDLQKDSVKNEFATISISRESLKYWKNEVTIKLKHSEDELERLFDKMENNRQEFLQKNFEFFLENSSEPQHDNSRKNSDPIRFHIDTIFTSENSYH